MDKKIKQQNNEEKDKKDFHLSNILDPSSIFKDIDEVLQRKVSKLGNSGHISIPSKHIGKDAIVTILKNEKEEED